MYKNIHKDEGCWNRHVIKCQNKNSLANEIVKFGRVVLNELEVECCNKCS